MPNCGGGKEHRVHPNNRYRTTNDLNIKVKELEKVDKYKPLREELERTWKMTAVVVPLWSEPWVQ